MACNNIRSIIVNNYESCADNCNCGEQNPEVTTSKYLDKEGLLFYTQLLKVAIDNSVDGFDHMTADGNIITVYFKDGTKNNIVLDKGNADKLGVVKLSDATDGILNGEDAGVAATPKAVALVQQALDDLRDNPNDMLQEGGGLWTDENGDIYIDLSDVISAGKGLGVTSDNEIYVKLAGNGGLKFNNEGAIEMVSPVLDGVKSISASGNTITWVNANGTTGSFAVDGSGGGISSGTPEQAGVVKLYDELGQNTDGAVTQKAVTDAIDAINVGGAGGQEGLLLNTENVKLVKITFTGGNDSNPRSGSYTVPAGGKWLIFEKSTDYNNGQGGPAIVNGGTKIHWVDAEGMPPYAVCIRVG